MRLKVSLLSLLTLLLGTGALAVWLNAPHLTKWADFFLGPPATQNASTTPQRTTSIRSGNVNHQVRRNRETAKAKRETSRTKTARATTSSEARQPVGKKKSDTERGLDVARINNGGTSVIAGHAQPKEQVTITADGNPIGTITADDNGEWVLVTPHKFTTKDPQLSVRKTEKSDAQQIAANAAPTNDNASTNAPAESLPKTASAESSPTAKRLVRNLEALVEDARREAQDKATTDETKNDEPVETQTATAQPTTTAIATQPETRTHEQPTEVRQQPTPQTANTPPSQPSSATSELAPTTQQKTPQATTQKRTADSRQKSDDTDLPLEDHTSDYSPGQQLAATDKTSPSPEPTGSAPTENPKKHTTSVPIPIGFVYREATFTENGKRAVALLGEYVTLKGFNRVVLTGHADERGTRALNKRLSADRLDAVAASLKANGFSGELVLIPKGESEPFTAVDRSSLSRDELYALDRRVELIDAN